VAYDGDKSAINEAMNSSERAEFKPKIIAPINGNISQAGRSVAILRYRARLVIGLNQNEYTVSGNMAGVQC